MTAISNAVKTLRLKEACRNLTSVGLGCNMVDELRHGLERQRHEDLNTVLCALMEVADNHQWVSEAFSQVSSISRGNLQKHEVAWTDMECYLDHTDPHASHRMFYIKSRIAKLLSERYGRGWEELPASFVVNKEECPASVSPHVYKQRVVHLMMHAFAMNAWNSTLNFDLQHVQGRILDAICELCQAFDMLISLMRSDNQTSFEKLVSFNEAMQSLKCIRAMYTLQVLYIYILVCVMCCLVLSFFHMVA
jgi:hypothetical protein